MPHTRKSQLDSWKFLVRLGASVTPRAIGETFEPTSYTSQFNPETERIAFTRTELNDRPLGRLTLDTLTVSRSTMVNVNFSRTSLKHAEMRWNRVYDCDFSRCVMVDADLRGSVYEQCSFKHAILDGADFRFSLFEMCSFLGASMNGVKLTYEVGDQLNLDSEQRDAIDWQDADGPVPDMG